jgi:hypothetical protein
LYNQPGSNRCVHGGHSSSGPWRKRGKGVETKIPGEEKPLSIRLLGLPEVSIEGRPRGFVTKKSLALLCYLAAEGGRHLRRDLAELSRTLGPSKFYEP